MSAGSTGLRGGPELMRFLDAFPKKLRDGALRAGATAAAAPIRDRARSLAQRQSGKMAKGIKSGSPRLDEQGNVRVRVRATGEHGFIAMWIERGVRPHMISADAGSVPEQTKKNGKRQKWSMKFLNKASREGSFSDVETGVLKIGEHFITGSVWHPGHAAHPFMRPALDMESDNAIKAFGERIRSYIHSKSQFTAPQTIEVDG